MGEYQRHIIAIRGDTHAGNDGGLKNPDTVVPAVDVDGNRVIGIWEPVTLRPFQRRLWEWHEDARLKINELAGNDPITFVDMGDLTQGSIFKDNLGDVLMSDQFYISKSSVTPWLEMPKVKDVYIAKGTSSHTWGQSSAETILTHQLQEEYPEKKVKIAEHWFLSIGGINLDIAHHGTGPGSRSWLRGNELSIYMRSMLMDEVALGEPTPDIVLRGHRHEFTRAWAWYQVGGKYWQVHGAITPSMCYIGTYATMAMKSQSRLSVGMIAIEVINGKFYDLHPYVHFVDLRTYEVE